MLKQAESALHELIKVTPLNWALSHEPEPRLVQDESTLPIMALEHEPSPMQDGPTTYGIAAYEQALVPSHEPSLQTGQEGRRIE